MTTTEEFRQTRALADRLFWVMMAAGGVILLCSLLLPFGVINTDALNIAATGTAMFVLPTAYLMRGLDRQAKRLLKRFLGHAQTSYIAVADPLAIISACVAVLARSISLIAIALPIPRIPDINLSPRLLPVPRAHMGAV